MDCITTDRTTTIGPARLMAIAYRGEDLTPTWTCLAARVQADPADAAAMLDLSTILLLTGERERGLQVQQIAFQLGTRYRRPHGRADSLRVLALAAPGDFMANTPLDFLLEGSDFALDVLYVQPGRPLPRVLPPHDICFLAIGESTENAALLAQLGPSLARFSRPVVNGAPDRIAALSRDGVCAMFADDPAVVVANTIRGSRASLAAPGAPEGSRAPFPGAGFPLIARPIDSHAGTGLCKIDTPEDLQAYLQERPENDFYFAPYVDYSSPDGLFRKQRIAFIDGKPFISHMAISEHWMVHYLSAGMGENAAKRAEEARFFADFETGFAVRHSAAFASLRRLVALDYFGIDCAELPDGRLLVFEVDVAMIVHALDPEDVYPYKKPAMAKLFTAFQAYLAARAGSVRAA